MQTVADAIEQNQTQSPVELLADLRQLKDQRDELARQDSELSKQVAAVQAKLLKVHEATGLEKFSGAGLSVSFNPAAMRVQYDPEQWNNIAKWAVESNNLHIIQRRLTDAKVLALIEEGTPLPPGLTVETFTNITVRRI